ncbi:MarR family transcriptional regulator [Isoptericola sp. b441]|uniref:MarR family transcriptional regulator n=1 Tax=Actinotalea lenta TaxID=3064654 RepID=A0ABT9D741_9CELL|nr:MULTISPECIES: MarR family transcriptional regulator [unclassified Isoptericola]MDO8106670.1 MarR family transcriptional regulator [Isoptericola sp. b441]MDO8121622.1 MarR family transcriptional regulator [Isoptericola sp. b490]
MTSSGDERSDGPVVVPPSACRPAPLAGDLRVAVTRATRRMRLERSSEQITDGQYAALAALANRGPMTTTALAEDQHVQTPPMSRTVGHLVDAGLVRRDEDPNDGRQTVLSLTEAGMTEVKETRRRRNAWLAQRLAELDPADREVLARAAVLLERIATR